MKQKGNLLNCMFVIVLMAVLSVGIVACSSGGGSTGVVGTWSGRDGYETLTLTFKSGGTGSWTLKYQEPYYGSETVNGSFTYEMDEDDTGVIIIRELDDFSGLYNGYLYFEIEGNRMYLYDRGYEEWVLTKQ